MMHLNADNRKTIIFGSRESALAMVQTQLVADAVMKYHPQIRAEILPMKTTGDRILDRPLDQIGGKGLFVRELDLALSGGRTDFSVHSLKDMPMEVPPDFPIVCCLPREDPRDALVLPAGVCEIDFDKPIGTGSQRRILQLREIYPQAHFAPLRGNIQTRLRKLDEEQYGAIVLAAAGLKRLGLQERISRYFAPDEVIPAAGQGILAVQGSMTADQDIFDGVRDEAAMCAAACERSFVRASGGDCTTPSAAYAKISGNRVHLRALYYDMKTDCWCRGEITAECTDAASCAVLGEQLAETLRTQCG